MEPTTPSESDILISLIGDIHLRDSQYANTGRSLDFFNAFEQAIVSSKEADVIVATGDIFDSSRPSPKVIGQLIRVDHMLQKMGVTMLCITGNHDRANPTWLETLFPREEGFGIVPLDDRSITIKGYKFFGIPPYTANQFRSNAAAIVEQCRDADVVLYHGFVTGVVPMIIGQDSNPLTIDDLPSSPQTKAVLLGDIHRQGWVRHKSGLCDKLVIYPGSTEMCSASEDTNKSVPMIRLTKETAYVETTVPIKTRLFISAKVRTDEELTALLVRLREVADQNPVVVVEFDRGLNDAIYRIHTAIDADKALIRCKPLPHGGIDYVRQTNKENDGRTIKDFMSTRLSDDVELEAIAMALIDRGDEDANNILAEFIERNTTSET
jgi:DNA repair exonuclease SbcCD nuclease subunit